MPESLHWPPKRTDEEAQAVSRFWMLHSLYAKPVIPEEVMRALPRRPTRPTFRQWSKANEG